ncbi:MAG: PAS domain S-box protein [Desulfovibrionales bacterium]
MSSTTLFHKNILENMHDGVMTLDMKGIVVMFNPAASKILGIPADSVLGRPFAEFFLMEMEGNDEFNQSVLDAVYQSAVDESRVVEFTRADGNVVHLSLVSSYLKEEQGDETRGVIVVFSDVTPIHKLTKAQERLNGELRHAYRELEDSNTRLESALKKVQVVRILATVLILGLFAGLGVTIWLDNPLAGSSVSSGIQSSESVGPGLTAQVQAQPLSSAISLTGTLAPLEEVTVVSPFAGNVKKKAFFFGERVEKGDMLVTLDAEEIEMDLRDARAAAIKARHSYDDLVNWDQGMEMTRSRRNLEKQRSLFQETEILFEKGIVPENEFRNVRDQYKNAQEEMESVRKKGSTVNVRIAEMELKNAESRVRKLEAKKRNNRIKAPVNGIIIKPSTGKEENQDIQVGMPLTEGQVLFAVGNLQGMSVTTQVDEVDVGNVHVDQKVLVTGEAFPGVSLKGRIVHVSSQASTQSGGNIPYFDLEVRIDELTDRQKDRVRVGMSAKLDVKVYDNPRALVLPLAAVRTRSGKQYVDLVLEDGTGREVEVRTGLTTMNRVEILEGLSEGDRVRYEPNRSGAPMEL